MRWTGYRRTVAPRLLLADRLGAGWPQFAVAGGALLGAGMAGWRLARLPGLVLSTGATVVGLRAFDRRADGAQPVLFPLPAGVTEAQARQATHGLPLLGVREVLHSTGSHLAVVCQKRHADTQVEGALAAAGLR